MNQNNTLHLFSDLRYRIHHVEICIRLLWKPQSYTNIGLISEQQHRWSNDRIERRCWRHQNISETKVRNLFLDVVVKRIFVNLIRNHFKFMKYNILLYSRIGEGGFAFVYEAVDAETRSRTYALKRLLAVDKEKRAAIVQEISILKTLSSHNR